MWRTVARAPPRLDYDRAMPIHRDVEQFLDLHEIDYEVMDCDPDLADTAQFCAAYGIPLDHSANAILVASKKPEGLYALCLVLATTRLDVNGAVRRRLGARKVSFASAEDTLTRTGQAIGGVTVFAIPDEIPIWVDRAVTAQDWVIVGAGTRSAKIRVDPTVFAEHARYVVVEELAKEEA
jgi:prolyl-tRNA editing enzyme YbaK/EbsC (Cys-tRNA(Pro) deacylase)